MGFTFSCPDCGESIQANEELAGLHGRCPHCAATFTIPERGSFRKEPPPSLETARDYEPVRRSRGRNGGRLDRGDPGWGSVATGLLLVRIGYLVVLLTVVFLGILLRTLKPAGPPRDFEVLVGLLAILGGLIVLSAVILAVVGQCMCCAAPAESATRGLAIGSLICVIVSLLLGIILLTVVIVADRPGNFGQARRDLGLLAVGLCLLTLLVGMVGHILFTLFLRGSANYFRNESLARSAGAYLVVYVVFLALAIGVFIVGVVLGNRPALGLGDRQVLFMVLVIGLLISAVVLLLWFLNLVSRTRAAIRRRSFEASESDYT